MAGNYDLYLWDDGAFQTVVAVRQDQIITDQRISYVYIRTRDPKWRGQTHQGMISEFLFNYRHCKGW